MGQVGPGRFLHVLEQPFPLTVQILEHIPSGCHIQDLAPSADRQYGLPLLHHPPDQGDFPRGPVRIDPPQSRGSVLRQTRWDQISPTR